MTSEKKVIAGSTNVFASKEMKDFKESTTYPLAWEIIFPRDKTGEAFSHEIRQQFQALPKEKAKLLPSDYPITDKVQCIECVFKDRDSLRQVLSPVATKFSFFDEAKAKVIPTLELYKQADQALKPQRVAAVC